MLATKAALASGGITHCCLRCGLRMFFLASARLCCRWRARQCTVRRPSPRAGAGSNGRNTPGPERVSAINFASATPSKIGGRAELGLYLRLNTASNWEIDLNRLALSGLDLVSRHEPGRVPALNRL